MNDNKKFKKVQSTIQKLYRKKSRTKFKFTECHCLTECSLNLQSTHVAWNVPLLYNLIRAISLFSHIRSFFFFKMRNRSETSLGKMIGVIRTIGRCHTIEFQLVHAG